jgi:hypothetical protein
MEHFKIELGKKVKDRVTGFAGTVTGRADYINGCHQYCVAAKSQGGKIGDSSWFDEDRLVKASTAKAKTVKRSSGHRRGGPSTEVSYCNADRFSEVDAPK